MLLQSSRTTMQVVLNNYFSNSGSVLNLHSLSQQGVTLSETYSPCLFSYSLSICGFNSDKCAILFYIYFFNILYSLF